ncbi:peptidylprolyl isomerase [Deinococcus metallilatus]|uniref:peptidylprolyl isomerase n=1 Tax=Deinococcus metallilatus TaxID=1211322 RepID=A0ABR6MXR7_9DEIO|nr:peptidylprolyl isomerase [Deinococcus metallilatus]MBB5296036.1 peptidyl-prolyl cis-trans isomerase C [Deinococcus metallilatus]GMA14428.1 peptidylprolyl isomerase [Deinococcus metallilatus]
MKNKKVVNVLLGVLALLLVVGMAYQFTPNVGSLFRGGQQGTPALKVNGQTVTTQDLEALRRGFPALAGLESGTLADDFKTFLVAQKARQVLLTQAAQDINVSRADVNAEVQKVREANNLTDNKAWTDALQGAGLTDAAFRQQTREQLAVNRKVEEIQKAAKPATDAEAQLYYELHPQSFQTDARIVGREIVVNDQAKAEALLKRIQGGADFAQLASQNSTEFKDRGGALGPVENGSPRPVAQVALPSDVGTAAFALTQGGVTNVIPSGGKFYIVKVEKYLPPQTKPFADAKADAVTAVNEQKKNAAVEQWLTGLEQNVKIEVLDPKWKTVNPTVASVAGQNIPYSDVVTQVVQNQQVVSLVGQMGDQAGQLINGILKPQIVEQLIQGYAAPTIVKQKNLALTGVRQELAAGLAAYGARNVQVTDADIQKYYLQNGKQFQTPASATVSEASFADRNKALTFRQNWNGQGDFTTAATQAGGTVSERGEVRPSTPDTPGTLEQPVEAAVFTAKTLRPVGEGSLSDVVKVGNRYVVAYVTDLKRASVQPLAAVRDQIRQQVLTQKRQEVGQTYLAQQVAALKPVNNLQKVLAAQQQRVAAETPKTPTPPASGEQGNAGTSGKNGTATEPAGGNGKAAPATPGGTTNR